VRPQLRRHRLEPGELRRLRSHVHGGSRLQRGCLRMPDRTDAVQWLLRRRDHEPTQLRALQFALPRAPGMQRRVMLVLPGPKRRGLRWSLPPYRSLAPGLRRVRRQLHTRNGLS
jgi:hypothetical protein